MTTKIAFYGDSTVYGATLKAGVVVQSANNVPAVVQALFDERFGAGAVECVNKGIGGTTSPQWLWGEGSVPRSWQQEMAESDAQLVLMCTGINDSFTPSISVADYRYCYAEFARLAALAGKRMVFATPNPINDGHLPALWDLQHNMTSVAAQVGVTVVDQFAAISAAAPQWRAMLPDNIHPNNDLYRFMGQTAYMTLQPLLPNDAQRTAP